MLVFGFRIKLGLISLSSWDPAQGPILILGEASSNSLLTAKKTESQAVLALARLAVFAVSLVLRPNRSRRSSRRAALPRPPAHSPSAAVSTEVFT